MIPRWTAQDETNLRRRVADLWRGRCVMCEADNHAHKAARVGPYLICRCLSCRTLVVLVADEAPE